MSGGTNGPPVYTGAPFYHKSETLLTLRNRLMIRLGFAAQLSFPPPGMTELLNDFLQDAQQQMYRRPAAPERMKRWWQIPIVEGQRHYDIPSITSGFRTDIATTQDAGGDYITRVAGSFITDGFAVGQIVTIAGGTNTGLRVTILAVTALQLTFVESVVLTTEAAGSSVAVSTVNYISADHRRVDHVYLQDGNQWWPMIEGIDPMMYNQVSRQQPEYYQWTSTLEVWPEPSQSYILWIYGIFGLLPFAADTDVTTIDPELVFLLALANAKMHYGQRDAQTYYRQAEVFLRQVNAENHGRKRYIPGTSFRLPNAVKPRQV